MNMEFAKKLLPELYGTEFSVRKIPICEQLHYINSYREKQFF